MPGTRNYYKKQNKSNGQISCISSHMWNPEKVHIYDMKLEGTVEGKEGVERRREWDRVWLFEWEFSHKSQGFEYLVCSWWLFGGELGGVVLREEMPPRTDLGFPKTHPGFSALSACCLWSEMWTLRRSPPCLLASTFPHCGGHGLLSRWNVKPQINSLFYELASPWCFYHSSRRPDRDKG